MTTSSVPSKTATWQDGKGLSRTAGDARWEVIAIVEVSVHSQPATNVPVGTREPLLVYLHGLGEIGGERAERSAAPARDGRG
jgi:hypothetical protein